MQESEAEQCRPESEAESAADENTAAGCDRGQGDVPLALGERTSLSCRLVRYTYNCANRNARRFAGAWLEVYRPPPQRESQQGKAANGDE